MLMKSVFCRILLVCTLLIYGIGEVSAQNKVQGSVFDTDSSVPLPGAAVSVENTQNFTTTDVDGKFTIDAKEGDVLLVQFMGFKDKKVTVGKSSTYEIILNPDSEKLPETVVTTLGMTREKRSLGYAVVELSGEELNQSQSNNWLGGLEGKVPGVQFNKASGPMSSMRVIVRGDPSLSGTGSALFVVDGVPIESVTTVPPSILMISSQ